MTPQPHIETHEAVPTGAASVVQGDIMKFKLTDSVRIIATPSAFFDEVGTIEGIDGSDYPFQVAGMDCRLLSFAGHELVLAENGVVEA